MRVVIAEDAVLLREGLARLLADAGSEVVATVEDAIGLVAAVERERPDVCVVDVRMPPTHTDEGIRAAIEIRARWPETAVLVLSQYVEERYATELLVGRHARRRLPAEGPGRRRARVPGRAPTRGRGRHRARSRGGGAAARAQPRVRTTS